MSQRRTKLNYLEVNYLEVIRINDTENDEIEMTLWRLRRVCSKKEVVSIPAVDVKDKSFDSVESWNYFVLATFQNRYPLYVWCWCSSVRCLSAKRENLIISLKYYEYYCITHDFENILIISLKYHPQILQILLYHTHSSNTGTRTGVS